MSTQLDLAWLDPSLGDLTRPDAGGPGSGLCRAIADRMGIDVIIVRVAFVILALSAGLGVALYAWGTALTRGRQGSRPIDTFLPSFATWRPGSQKALLILSTLVFTIAIAASTPLPWGAGVLALGALLFLRRRHGSGVVPSGPRPVAPQDLSVDAQLAAWRQRLSEAAGASAPAAEPATASLPVAAAPERPRARTSWLAGLAVLGLGAAATLVAHLAAGLTLDVSLALGTLAAGAGVAAFAIAVRTRRVPRLVLGLLAAAVAVTGWFATASAVAPELPADVKEITVTASSHTVDLGAEDLEGVDEVVVRVVASDVTVALPGPVRELNSNLRLSDLTTDGVVEAASGTVFLDRLTIEATVSDVEVVRLP